MSKTYIYYRGHGLSADEYKLLEHILPQDKRQRQHQFYHKADVDRALLGQVIRRHAIYLETKIPYGEQLFLENDFGKPLFQNNPNVHFNISHAGGYVVCAIDEQPIGIDVEEIQPIGNVNEPLDLSFMDVADRFFSDNEKHLLHHAPWEQKSSSFFHIWTMKESYIKRQGQGLSIPLNSFDVLYTSDGFFHKVFETPGAVCHVCTSTGIPPKCIHIILDDLLPSYL